VPGIDDATFQRLGTQAKENCPISKTLGALDEITLDATLEQ
jgi:osmotically inducible protein OsmC